MAVRISPYDSLGRCSRSVWFVDIPLRYLLSHSTTLSTLDPPPTETAIAKTIRSQDDDALEIRVLVSAPSRSAWYGKDSARDQLGGYEVRRRDWADVLQRIQQLTEDDWTASTIYAVCHTRFCSALSSSLLHCRRASPSNTER